MAVKQLPPTETLRQRLRYDPDSGFLYWRERAPEDFKPTAHRSPEYIAKRWNAQRAGNKAGHEDRTKKTGGVKLTLDGASYHAARVVWAIHHGAAPSHFVDHINGDRFDNRIENLREVTASENSRNKVCTIVSATGYRGVYPRGKRFAAVAKLNGKYIRIGYFDTAEDAAAARIAFDAGRGFTARHQSAIAPSHLP